MDIAGDIILDPAGNDVLPASSYAVNLGSSDYKFLREKYHGFIIGDKYIKPEDRKPSAQREEKR